MPEQRDGLAPLIAIVGCDGSGKSTVSEEILTWARRYGPAEAAHLGKQAGNIARAIAQWPLIGRPLDKWIARKADKTRALHHEKTPGFMTALVIFAFSLRRLRRFKRMMALRRQGRIIIADRFPQLEVQGAYDGPGLSVAAPGSPFVRWLARRERAMYERMTAHRPDLVLRLNVDLDTACARKPDHRREVLRHKIEATPLLTFNGATMVDIDANRSLAEVLTDARAAVAHALKARGYALHSEQSA